MESSADQVPESIMKELSPRDREIFRQTCGDLLILYGAEKIREHITRKNLKTRDLIGLMEFMRDTAYGKPTTQVQLAPTQIEFNPIVISPDAAAQAAANDAEDGII